MTPAKRLGVAGAALALVTTAAYVAVIVREGNDTVAEVAPWASAFAAIGFSAAVATALRSRRAGAALFATGAGAATALGLVALMSIGILLLGVAALLLGAAAAAADDPATAAWIASGACVATLVAVVALP